MSLNQKEKEASSEQSSENEEFKSNKLEASTKSQESADNSSENVNSIPSDSKKSYIMDNNVNIESTCENNTSVSEIGKMKDEKPMDEIERITPVEPQNSNVNVEKKDPAPSRKASFSKKISFSDSKRSILMSAKLKGNAPKIQHVSFFRPRKNKNDLELEEPKKPTTTEKTEHVISMDDESAELDPAEDLFDMRSKADKVGKQKYNWQNKFCSWVYTIFFCILIAFYPLWLKSIILSPHDIHFYPPKMAIDIHPFPPIQNCSQCVNGDATFNVTLSLSKTLIKSPFNTASHVVLFSSTDFNSWYVSAVSNRLEFFTTENRTMEIINGCFGQPGPMYMVACGLLEGMTMEQGQSTDPPPFNDRCTVLGARCGSTCSAFVANPPLCQNGQIPEQDLVFTYATSITGEYTTTSGPWIFSFIFFSFNAYFQYYLTYLPGVLHPKKKRFKKLNRIQKKYLQEGIRPKLITFTAAAGESPAIFLRTVLGTLLSFPKSTNVWDLEFLVYDDSGKAKFKTIWCNLLPRINSLARSSFGLETLQLFAKALKEIDIDDDLHDIEYLIPFSLRKVLSDLESPETVKNPLIIQEKDENHLRFDLSTLGIKCIYVASIPSQGKASALRSALKAIRKEGSDIGETFFAIIDCRHMTTPAFWKKCMPRFYIHNEKDEVVRDLDLRFVQVRQEFGIPMYEDFFDRQNQQNFLFSMVLRDRVAAVTSCGTNSIWSLHNHKDGKPFLFCKDTLIEDTETSHMILSKGEESSYIHRSLVFGIPKNAEHYSAAVFRWSRGAVQLCYLSMNKLFPFHLLMFVANLALTLIVYLLPNSQILLWIISAFLVTVIILGKLVFPKMLRRISIYLIMHANTTYWFSGLSAVYWALLLPMAMTFSNQTLFIFNVEIFLAGSLIIWAATWFLITIAKQWGKCRELFLWRANQMWVVMWPVHLFAFLTVFWEIISCKIRENKTWKVEDKNLVISLKVINVAQIIGVSAGLLYAVIQISFQPNPFDFVGISGYIIGAILSISSLVTMWGPVCFLILGKPVTTSYRHIALILLFVWLFIFISSNELKTFQTDWSNVL